MEHDPEECADCQVSNITMNEHVMQVVVTCDHESVIWMCVTCESIEEYPVMEDAQSELMMIRQFMYLHCLDQLVLEM